MHYVDGFVLAVPQARLAEYRRMAPVVGDDKPAHPLQVHPLGGQAVMLQPQLAANFVEQAWTRPGLLAACYRRGFAAIRHIGSRMPDSAGSSRCITARWIGQVLDVPQENALTAPTGGAHDKSYRPE